MPNYIHDQCKYHNKPYLECGCTGAQPYHVSSCLKEPEPPPCPECPGEIIVTPSTCQYTWNVAPGQIAPGGEVVVSFAGLPAFKHGLVLLEGPNTNFTFEVKADSFGAASKTLQMPVDQGVFQFRPVFAGCVADVLTRTVTVVSESTGPGPCSCDGAVTATPTFNVSEVKSGAPVTLTVRVDNTNQCPITALNMPPVALPTSLQGGPVSITNSAISGNSSQDFKFILIAKNDTQLDVPAVVTIPAGSATYKCNDELFFAGGGQAQVTVKSESSASCGLNIDRFDFSPPSIQNNSVSTVTLVVKNVGQSNITGLNFGPFSVASATVTASSPNTLSIVNESLTPGQTKTVTLSCTFASVNPITQQLVHQLTIPAGAVTGICSGGVISNTSPISTSLLLNP